MDNIFLVIKLYLVAFSLLFIWSVNNAPHNKINKWLIVSFILNILYICKV